MKHTTQKTIVAISMIIIFVLEPISATALFSVDVSGKVRGGINDFLENDLNINVQKGLRPMAETINSADRKVKSPEVSIRFSTPNPKEGEVITASAEVAGIANVQDAYYTWYIKGPTRNIDTVDILDDDILKKMHILAVRAQAGIYFNPLMFDQKMNGGDSDGDFIDDYPDDEDDDGFSAPLGGGNMKGDGTNYCYVYDTNSGVQYEITEPGKVNLGCPSGFVPRCMKDERLVQCPTIVDGVEGTIETEANSEGTADDGSSSGTASSETSAETSAEVEIGGGGGARFRILARCVGVAEEPICHNGKLSCSTSDGSFGTNYDYDSHSITVPTPFCVKKYEVLFALFY